MASKSYPGIWYVYELPEEQYVGTTKQWVTRMSKHKAKGRNVDRMRKLKAFTSRSEALAYERNLQENQGYLGNNYSKERNAKLSDNMKGNFYGTRLVKKDT